MKKSTYDAISTIALVSLVAFTIASQHSSRAGYAFGVLAVLTAAVLFAAYIKASPEQATTSDQTTETFEEAIQQASEVVAQREALTRNVREDLYRMLLLIKRQEMGVRNPGRWERAARTYEALYKERLSERQLLLFCDDFNAVAHHGTAHLKAGSYYTQIRIRRDPVHDSASIIANIVEKLCASSKEPRFEFILEPDGRFKIQQISAKRAAVVEPIVPQEEPVEAPAEPEEPQVIN